MNIQVTKEKTTDEVQAEFCAAFPFLKLAFFDQVQPFGAFPFTVVYGGLMPGGSVENSLTENISAIEEKMSVGEVEQLLNTNFGLCVRVLRRSGDRWQDVSVAPEVSLSEHNAQGQAGRRVAMG